MDPTTVDSVAARSGRRHAGHRQERHRFRGRIRAFWRRVNGWPEEPEVLVDGLALTDAPAEVELNVLQILGGCQRLRRLLEIGIYPGARLQVVRAGDRGPVIIKSGEMRLAIGRNVARSILVEMAPVP